jgi:hypothetical protein
MSTNGANVNDSTGGFWSNAKPDWPGWSRTKRCQLWQAIALACNVDPNIGGLHDFMRRATEDRARTPLPAKISELLESAKSAVGSGTFKVAGNRDANLIQREIELSDFATWLQLIGHETPPEFHWTPQDLENGPLLWPWGKYQTTGLRLLAGAANKYWKHYDPGDSSTAPKNAEVEAWLIEQGISKRRAEVIASLLRADDLRTGPR